MKRKVSTWLTIVFCAALHGLITTSAQADVFLSTDFSGRTVSGKTASTITWATNGVSNPGDLTVVDIVVNTVDNLFDTANAQDHLAVANNVGNGGIWETSFDIDVLTGSITLTNVNLYMRNFNGIGGFQTTAKSVKWTISATNGIEGASVSAISADVDTESASHLVQILFDPGIVLAGAETWTITIRAEEGIDGLGNNVGIDSIAFLGTIAVEENGIVWSATDTTNITTSSAWASATVNTNLTTCVLVWDTSDHTPGATNDWPNRISLDAQGAGTVTTQMTSLAADTAYVWRFYGENAETNGWSAATSFDTAFSATQTPVFTNAGALSESAILLGWEDNAQNETGYVLQRSETEGSGYATVATLDQGVTVYTNSGLTASTTYYYQLAATNSANGSSTVLASCRTNAVTSASEEGLIAYYPFDEDFNDAVGVNHLTTGGGTPVITTTAGEFVFDGALDLAQSSAEYLNLTTSISFATNDAWSVSFWARRRSGTAVATGMVMGDNTTDDSFIWLTDNASQVQGMRFRPVGVGTSDNNDYATGHDTDFHHWVVVADGQGTIRGYRDKVDLGTKSPSGGSDFDILTVGSGYTGVNQIFDGQLDDLAIFNVALTAAQVTNLFNGDFGEWFGGIAWSDEQTTNITTSTAWATATVNTNLTTCVLVWDTSDHVPGTTNDWPEANRLSLGTQSEGVVTTQMTGLTSGTEYVWRLYGENAETNGWSAAIAFETLFGDAQTPVFTVANALSSTSIMLGWNDNALNETGYILQRSTTAGSGYATIATLDPDTTSYQDVGRAVETTYYYQLTATNSANGSATLFADCRTNATTKGSALFEDDFESYSAGAGTAALEAGPWGESRGAETVRDEGTATPFGSPNQYVELKDAATGNYTELQSPNIAAASAVLTTFAFDFLEPSSGGGDVINIGYAMTGESLNSTGRRVSISLNDGTIGGLTTTRMGTYSLDTAYRLHIIFNDTASDVDHSGYRLTAGTAHVWYTPLSGGYSVYVGAVEAANEKTASYRVGFRTFNAPLQELWVDNVLLTTGLPDDLQMAPPQPSVFRFR